MRPSCRCSGPGGLIVPSPFEMHNSSRCRKHEHHALLLISVTSEVKMQLQAAAMALHLSKHEGCGT